MNIAMLSTLQAILERGSFTAAAQVAGCTPSAVSLQVRQMERYFGQPLFDRSTRTVRPTPFAREVVAAVGEFSTRLQVLRARPILHVQGRLRLGVITSMQTDVLPPVLALLKQDHPSLQVVVPPLNDTDELLAELKAGRIEMALIVRPANGGSRRLAWKDLHAQPYVLLAPAQATARTARQLLQAHEWIAYDTSIGGGRVAARLARGLLPQARPVLELRSTDAILAMVAEGLGVSILPQPRRALLGAYPVREVSLGSRAPSRRISLAWRSSDDESRNVQAVAAAFATIFLKRSGGGASAR
jgi:DNA-binding transcriptional LysR family regulator